MTDAQDGAITEAAKKKRERSNRPFPSSSYDDAESFARQAYDFASGNPVRRLLLFDHLQKSPESSGSRDLITNSAKYGLTKGNYKSELLEFTPEGKIVLGERSTPKQVARARVTLAVESIPTFAQLYDRFCDLKLPARAALIDAAREIGVPAEFLEECVDTFQLNLKSVGLLQSLSGVERIVKVDHLVDQLPTVNSPAPIKAFIDSPAPQQNGKLDEANYEKICFYVTPIGDDGSDYRKHSDLFLSHIVEPALEQFGLTVVRADQIGKPGIISRQVFEYLIKSRLVIADLSFHNPNVFYELAVRHVIKKPVVQISRIADKIPFDINQMRTIIIDNTDIYTLLPKIELYKAEIATQTRKALEESGSADNPVSIYFPHLEVKAL